MTRELGQKIVEWAVVAALVGVIGYLIGNSDAMTMSAAIERQGETIARHEREITALETRITLMGARVERLDARDELTRQMRRDEE